jgi:Domain of unknown function (DUF4148)
MFAKQALIAITLAFAGTAAMADDITIANDSFVATKSRAEVRAEVVQARAAGVLQFSSEFEPLVQPATSQPASSLTREAVRAEVLKSPRIQVLAYNPAA